MKYCVKVLILATLCVGVTYGGGKYRTFSQFDLAQKKGKPGKSLASDVCFRFYNTTGDTVNDLHARLNAGILNVDNDGGFPFFDIGKRGKEFDASGMAVPPGDSVTICLRLDRKGPGSQVNFWWWTKDGERIGDKNGESSPIDEVRIQTQPNGGNILSYLYKRIIRRPAGLLVGLPSDTPGVGWIRYMNAQRKAFPHTGSPRCLDFIASGTGRLRTFDRQLRNPHVKKHDNHLVGELHALKLAVVANDSGVSEPLDTAVTLFGDLIYNDSLNTGDPCNGRTVREIIHLADSALTYCSHFSTGMYEELDDCVSRINAAFGGAYAAASFNPFILAGSADLDDIYFMHDNPGVPPALRPAAGYSIMDEIPSSYSMRQNYPNPFNPTTTIEFGLAEPSAVTLTVYNMLGEVIATILSGEVLDEGFQSADFDGSTISSGVYVYRMTAQPLAQGRPPFHSTIKMILIK